MMRVQSPLAPALFWAQAKPLLELKQMNPGEFKTGPDSNQAGVRNGLQASFRYFGLTQLPRLTTGCAFSGGNIKGAHYNVYMWPNKGGTMAEFWLRDQLK